MSTTADLNLAFAVSSLDAAANAEFPKADVAAHLTGLACAAALVSIAYDLRAIRVVVAKKPPAEERLTFVPKPGETP